MVNTLARMARKKNTTEQEAAESHGTMLIRVDADLAEMLSIIAAKKKRAFNIAHFVSPIIRPHVVKLYKELVQEMADNLPGE